MGLFSGKPSWKDEYDQRVNDPDVHSHHGDGEHKLFLGLF